MRCRDCRKRRKRRTLDSSRRCSDCGTERQLAIEAALRDVPYAPDEIVAALGGAVDEVQGPEAERVIAATFGVVAAVVHSVVTADLLAALSRPRFREVNEEIAKGRTR